jgi:large subunit ribosomal protein L18
MRPIRKPKTKRDLRDRRHFRVRRKIAGTAERPRLVVFRSTKHIYGQLVDDVARRTITAASDLSKELAPEGTGKTAKSLAVGELLAERAKAHGVKIVVFDRGGYRYHGRVKAVADGARKGGLEF